MSSTIPTKRTRVLPDDPSPEAAAYTERQFRARWPIGHTKFHSEIAAGYLRKVKLGRRTLILRGDAEAWAAARLSGGAA